MNKKMMFFDIDGTLIDCGLGIYSIPTKTRNALDQLQQKGHDVFLATGRAPAFIMDGVKDYAFSGYVTCNGAYVEYQGKEVFKQVISVEAITALHELCKKHHFRYYLEGKDAIYVLDKTDPKYQTFATNWEMNDKIVFDQYDASNIEVYIAMIEVNDVCQHEIVKQELEQYFDIQRHHSILSADLNCKGITKAVGIDNLVKQLDRSIEDTVAFGDALNDLQMLQFVGFGVAMGNGCQEVKDVSDYVTTRVEEDGINQALLDLGYL